LLAVDGRQSLPRGLTSISLKKACDGVALLTSSRKGSAVNERDDRGVMPHPIFSPTWLQVVFMAGRTPISVHMWTIAWYPYPTWLQKPSRQTSPGCSCRPAAVCFTKSSNSPPPIGTVLSLANPVPESAHPKRISGRLHSVPRWPPVGRTPSPSFPDFCLIPQVVRFTGARLASRSLPTALF